jgi:hypothetical protein
MMFKNALVGAFFFGFLAVYVILQTDWLDWLI